MKLILKAAAIGVFCAIFASCSGGGGDETVVTVRPQTLDGLVLSIDADVRFEFIRATNTPAAVQNGSIETGTFAYALGGVQLRQYPNQGGDISDVRWPDAITGATYTYQAINDQSALLTLSGLGVNDLTNTGTFNALNGSFCFFFNSMSSGLESNEVEVDMTFVTTADGIEVATVTLRVVGTTTPEWDVTRAPATIRLLDNTPVPGSYNPDFDPLAPSKIAPESLNDTLISFVNGIPDPSLDFTIQFTQTTFDPFTGIETGFGVERIAGAPVLGGTPIAYTWERIPGTDTGRLVISDGGNIFDGSYILDFFGKDNGTYTGSGPNVSGTFFIPNDLL